MIWEKSVRAIKSISHNHDFNVAFSVSTAVLGTNNTKFSQEALFSFSTSRDSIASIKV